MNRNGLLYPSVNLRDKSPLHHLTDKNTKAQRNKETYLGEKWLDRKLRQKSDLLISISSPI